MYLRIPLLFLLSICAGCGMHTSLQTLPNARAGLLDSLLKHSAALQQVIDNKDSFRLQIIYTQIDRDAGNKPSFTDYTFNVNAQRYFYPASTVKMPAAILSLEKLNNLRKIGVDKYTTMITDSSYQRQQKVLNSPLAEDGRPSVAEDIKEIFLVSDNEAFNRLYEFLGQDYFNSQLHKKGYKDTEIRHRLSITMTDDQNRHTNAVSFYDTAAKLLYAQPPQMNTQPFVQRNEKIGKAFYRGDSLIKRPFDFSEKNKFSLTDYHLFLRSVIFPEAVSKRQRFNLNDDDYSFLYKYMSARPRESSYPNYDSSFYWDAYCKFLMFGSERGTMPGNIRIFNKIGEAYGFLTDIAYIVDFDSKTEFMLSATLLCNSDGIFNDDKYDYDTIGFPFLKNLGLLIYNYEKHRPKKHLPDLRKFVINYTE